MAIQTIKQYSRGDLVEVPVLGSVNGLGQKILAYSEIPNKPYSRVQAEVVSSHSSSAKNNQSLLLLTPPNMGWSPIINPEQLNFGNPAAKVDINATQSQQHNCSWIQEAALLKSAADKFLKK